MLDLNIDLVIHKNYFSLKVLICIFLYSSTVCNSKHQKSFTELQVIFPHAYAYKARPANEHVEAQIVRQRKMKYILVWTTAEFGRSSTLGNRQDIFIENDCPVKDCYITDNRYFFEGDFEGFDALIFKGYALNVSDLPDFRSPHQKYIYMNQESAIKYPVCHEEFDYFFNLTYTYRLDSDILYNYFLVRDMEGNVVGPKINMQWNKTMTEYDEELENKWKTKSIAVAWIVSNCKTSNMREYLVKKIALQLKYSNLQLDIYGRCNQRKQPDICLKRNTHCWAHIQYNYYFYLAFEDSNAEDYVTKKVVNPLQYFTIPIVYGGANYSREMLQNVNDVWMMFCGKRYKRVSVLPDVKLLLPLIRRVKEKKGSTKNVFRNNRFVRPFLPEGSYLDASKISPKKLVSKISKIISSRGLYRKYFAWRKYYQFDSAVRDNVCSLCSTLHDKSIMKKSTEYEDFRRWWLPEYKQVCRKLEKQLL